MEMVGNYTMLWFSIIFLIIILMFTLKVKVNFNVTYEGKLDYKIYVYKLDVTKFVLKSKVKEERVKEREVRLKFKVFIKVFMEILNKIKILKKPKVTIKNIVEIGNGEANVTALLCVFLYDLIYLLLGFFSKHIEIEKDKIQVIPVYNQEILKIKFQGILQIKIVQIIYISFLFITLGRRLNGTTSNRKLNEKYT